MKKAVSLILALVMCLSLSACGNKGVELTLENYSTYLNLDIGSFAPADVEMWNFPGAPGCREKYLGFVNCKGASTNYDYNNIQITVRFFGTGDIFVNSEKESYEFDETVTITCDISGKGSKSVDLFAGKCATRMINGDSVNCTWEILSISGTVTRVK